MEMSITPGDPPAPRWPNANGPAPRPNRRVSLFTGLGDAVFRLLCQAAAVLVVVLAAALVAILIWRSWDAIQTTGITFFTTSKWDPEPSHRHFGALAFVYGTIVTSVIAMLLAVPLGVGTADIPCRDRPALDPANRVVPRGDAGGHPQRGLRLLGALCVRAGAATGDHLAGRARPGRRRPLARRA